MNTKTTGSIGQRYEDRRTGKEGTLTARDEDNRRLELVDKDNNTFYVSYAAFKSNWRKVKTDNKVENDVVMTVTEPEISEDNVITLHPVIIKKCHEVLENISKRRNLVFNKTDAGIEVYVDNILVLKVKKTAKANVFSMLPDIYTNSDYYAENMVMDYSNDLSVTFQAKDDEIDDIFSNLETSIETLNTYGYIFED